MSCCPRALAAWIGLLLLSGCGQPSPPAPTVVVYTSVDRAYAEPILRQFEQTSGIRVLPVYDVEATKTTGLAQRLIAEKNRPQADVFWNGEFVQTLRLKEQGVLAMYRSPNSQDVPTSYRDGEGYWTAVGGRARVLIVNQRRLTPAQYPKSLQDFLNPAYPAQSLGMSYPQFGTAATHAAALYEAWGANPTRRFYQQVKQRGVRLVDGNSVVRDQVASGQLSLGIVDTDDACAALERQAPIALIFPDQQPNGQGTLVVPNTVALIAGAPHRATGEQLVDYLLSRSVETELVKSGWIQIPTRVSPVGGCLPPQTVKAMSVSLSAIYRGLPRSQADLREIFLR